MEPVSSGATLLPEDQSPQNDKTSSELQADAQLALPISDAQQHGQVEHPLQTQPQLHQLDVEPRKEGEGSVPATSAHVSSTSSPSTGQVTQESDIPSSSSSMPSDGQGLEHQSTSQPLFTTADEQEDLEAVAQAEDGHIVVDSDEASDGGYASDTVTAASTSLASSVRDYAFENGRRYHRFREGRYNFPNDDVEQEREDMKHAMVRMLCQQLHFAPIGDHPQQMLDIGTGTGIWAIEMADQFPSATVLGVDLSPIQPEWVPPNVRFMVDDVESPWLHPSNYFDYIHSRHTVMAIKDWPRLFRRSLE